MTETRDLADLARSICPGDPPDLGIVWELHILREAGVETFESCEGGPDHSYSEPTIRFYGTRAAGWHALSAAQNHGLPVRRLSRTWPMEDGEPSGPVWEITFRQRA